MQQTPFGIQEKTLCSSGFFTTIFKSWVLEEILKQVRLVWGHLASSFLLTVSVVGGCLLSSLPSKWQVFPISPSTTRGKESLTW